MPRSTVPACGAAARAPAGLAARFAGLRRRSRLRRRRAAHGLCRPPVVPSAGAGFAAGGSPKQSSASRRTASSASAACGPAAVTSSSSPCSAPSSETAVRLRALTGPRALVRSATVTCASNRPAVRTSRAAGRACSPSAGVTVTRIVAAGAERRPRPPATRSSRSRSRHRLRRTPCARPSRPPSCRAGDHGARAGLAAALFPELRRLGLEPAARRLGARLQRVAEPGRHGRRHGALHQRRGRQQHLAAPFVVEQVQRELRGEQRAAQVHEHQHAVVRPGVRRWPGPRERRRCPARPARRARRPARCARPARPSAPRVARRRRRSRRCD